MSDDEGAAIDPRYDPAFQRGFSGEVSTEARGQSTLRRTAAVNPLRTASPVAREGEPSPRIEMPSSAAEPVAQAPLAADGAGAPQVAIAAPVATATPRELARNPFVIGLAALGAVLIIAGAVWAYEGFATIIRNGGTRNEVEFWAAQTMSFGAPLAIGLGLSVAAVLLVLFGRAWQRTRL